MKNNLVDVCVSFDTTGSMYPCLTQVRRVVENLTKDLFSQVPDIRVGIIAHGDYCDEGKPYTIRVSPLTDKPFEVCSFIRDVPATYGGDAPECYELVLHTARSLQWREGAKRVLLLIGDDVPHGPSYPQNTKKLNWRTELDVLQEMGVNVYAVHALAGCRKHSQPFYREIAEKTGGFYLTLEQFSTINDLILAVCYKQVSDARVEQFQEELEKSNRFTRNHEEIIYTLLKKKGVLKERSKKAELGGRFQVFDIESDSPIREFVLSQGVEFKKGRGFYQLSKAETIQGNKELILVDKKTFDIYASDSAREILGLPAKSSKDSDSRQDVRLQFFKNRDNDIFKNYYIFVQSTSVNRRLVGGTKFLYEIPDWEK